MAYRDRTSAFFSFRDLRIAGSGYRRRAARRSVLGGTASSSNGLKTRTSGQRDYVAVTMGEVEDEDDSEGADPIWVEYRDHVNNCVHEVEKLLRELSTAHREDLTGFEVRGTTRAESVATRVTAKLREAELSIKKLSVIPDKESSEAYETERMVRQNLQTELSSKLYRVTSQFRKQQKQYIRDKLALEQKNSKFANHFMNAADDIELPPDASEISDAQLHSMAISKHLLSDRDSQIAKIAQGVQEIATLFKDLATMTIEQGTILDRIDHELDMTLENTKQGVEELHEAENIQKQNSKSLKCVAVLVAIVTIEACLLIVKHT